MNWLNLNVQTLDSETFLGAEPLDRATWLCLLRYCIGQENGGVIASCKDWGDRKWQQLVRVTKKESARVTELWSWDGDTLTVWGYPDDKEAEVKQRRDHAKTNGKKGGRPKKTDIGLDIETQDKPTLVISGKAEGEEKDKEKGREGEVEEFQHPRPPKFEEIMAFAKSAPLPVSDECAGKFFDEMESLQWTYKGQPCIAKNAWHARFRMFITAWNQNEQGRNFR